MPNYVYDDDGKAIAKECRECNVEKPLSEFCRQPNGKYGVGSYCKPCDSERGKKHYRENKVRHASLTKAWQERNRDSIRSRYDEKKARIDILKSEPCMDCGGIFPPCAMDFDHRDPSKKSFGIGSGTNHGWEAILAEIAKCDLVCSNCHRIRTFYQQQQKKLSRAA